MKKPICCSFDVETTGLNPYEGIKIFAFCIGFDNGEVEVYRLDNKSKQENDHARDVLQGFLYDTSIIKTCHNYKFEYTCLSLISSIKIQKSF